MYKQKKVINLKKKWKKKEKKNLFMKLMLVVVQDRDNNIEESQLGAVCYWPQKVHHFYKKTKEIFQQ